MAKFNENEIQIYKQFITIADMKEIAPKHGLSWQTLRRILIGEAHYDVPNPDREAMVKEASKLGHKRATEAIKVFAHKTVK